jgi:alginate O-acetyltransferase complex protein AlgI
MVFSSNIFLFLFLPLTLFLYFILPEKLVGKKYKNYLLLVASLIFYAWGEMQYLWLLLFSILGNYFFGIVIFKASFEKGVIRAQARTENLNNPSQTPLAFDPPSFSKRAFSLSKKITLFIAIAFNLVLLGYFKYANFLVENINLFLANFSSFQITLKKVHLPIGISFFTFHSISYLVDIYRKKCLPQKNILDLALYIAFFPQLIAGPIVRYNFIEKYLANRRHNLFFVAYGIRKFLIGLGKKIIIANPLGELADAIFSLPATEINTTIAWVGIVCYTLQIYFDFSGYSDMAVGLARIFGLKFPENFNYPYISKSIKEFWRRWHMSLSAWFRDYVYIPLGGNRVSLSRQYFNLILVFFLCGLWHGSSWNFIIWGLFHGFFLVFERIKIGEKFLSFLPNFLQHFYMILIVMIGWVFFRSPDLSYALNYLQAMFVLVSDNQLTSDVSRLMNSHFIFASFIFALLGFSPFIKNYSLKLIRQNRIFITVFDIFLIATLIFSIIRISASTHNPFIYFQF